MAYEVIRLPDATKDIRWDSELEGDLDRPTLAELIEAATKEFPEVPFEQLIITASGYDAETIWLTPRKPS